MIDACKEGESARSICELGDKLILEETNKVYKKEKELKKGLSFTLFVFEQFNIMSWFLTLLEVQNHMHSLSPL